MSTEKKDVVGKEMNILIFLRAPNEGLIKSYVEGLLDEFMYNPEVKLCLTLKLCKQFRTYTEKLSNKMKAKTACRLAAKNLVHTILTLRKTNAGKFLKHVREVNCLDINDKSDFGDPLHSVHSEPFTMRQPICIVFNQPG